MFFAYKSPGVRILVAFTTLVGIFNPALARFVITGTGLLPDNYELAQNVIDPTLLQFQPMINGLSQPVFITHAGDTSDRLFILERAGRIRIVKNGMLLSTPFLNMQSIVNSTGSEQGLLALAFHPQFESNGYFYTVHTNSSGTLVLSRFTASPVNTDQASFNSRIELLLIPHPTHANHNGGTLAFGPDGYLYWSTGDGGGGGDPFNNAQNLNSLLGKILRLDVNSASPYAIPATNPFFNNPNPAVRKEIWAYGLRNPWRFSFDSLTYDIYIGDVGQSNIEEINFQAANSSGGENYGWRVMEGSSCYNPSSGCNQSGKVLPIAEYSHALGCSVTGGYVYRGSNYPSLYGHYFYGDYCSGRLFSIYKDAQLGWQPVVELDTSFNISTFGEDEQGELYLADYSTGILYNIGYQEPVSLSGNVGVGGVTLSYTDDIAKTAISSANGDYVLSVSHNWSGTVEPSHACFTFNPTQRDYVNIKTNQTAQDYVATFNPASGCAEIDTEIAGNNVGHYGVLPGDSLRDSYPDVDDGPVKVTSTNNLNIITALRNAWSQNGIVESWSQLMGLPDTQLSTAYYFPAYNNVTLSDQLRFANLGNAQTTVTVKIGSVVNQSYVLQAGESLRVSYPGVDSGPVTVSSNSHLIIAALREAWSQNGIVESWSQLMGLPETQLSTAYYFPAYNNVTLSDQLRFANLGNAQTTVTVKIGSVVNQSYVLQAGESLRVSYPGVDSGPVTVSSDGEHIIAAVRNAWSQNGIVESWVQLMGLPETQLSTTYYFPAYNNVTLSDQLRFANLGNSQTTVTVKIGSVVNQSYVLQAGESLRVSYPGVDAGPVTVSSDGQLIIAALRNAWSQNGIVESWVQLMGLPASQLSDIYYFPAYNNVTLSDQLRIAVP